MPELIQTNAIEGFTVYGQQMVDYAVDGMEHCGYSYSIGVAALANTASMERAISGILALTKMRQKKMEDLGSAISVIVKALDTMKKKDQSPGDKSSADVALLYSQAKLAQYGINLKLDGDFKIRRDDAGYAQNDIQYAMDNENNDLQQDMITLQSMINKRDSAYSSASKLMNKAEKAGSTIIRSM
ncbi:MAG: hypothetical protein MJ106_00725 [Lentisphaeria bacterium]|nr:hypothetical protein [Lentisphaeria bacterium]